MRRSIIFASFLCSLRSSEFFGSDSSCSLIRTSLSTNSIELARNHSCAAFSCSETGPSIRTSPVTGSMMTSSGWGTGSGPEAPLRARSARTGAPMSLILDSGREKLHRRHTPVGFGADQQVQIGLLRTRIAISRATALAASFSCTASNNARVRIGSCSPRCTSPR